MCVCVCVCVCVCASMCVCVCVCVCAHASLFSLCFQFLVLCFVMGYVLQSGDTAYKRINRLLLRQLTLLLCTPKSSSGSMFDILSPLPLVVAPEFCFWPHQRECLSQKQWCPHIALSEIAGRNPWWDPGEKDKFYKKR